MENNKRTSKIPTFSTGSKKSRLDIHTGPATNTRSKSKERPSENKENVQHSTKKSENSQKSGKKKVLLPPEKTGGTPLGDLTHNFNNLPKPSAIPTFKRKLSITDDKFSSRDSQKFFDESSVASSLPVSLINESFKHKYPKVTFRDSNEENEKEYDFSSFSTEDLSKAGPSKTLVRYSESLHKMVSLQQNSPFKDRIVGNQIIYDGIPSLRKKTLRKDLVRPSGYKGIVDMDPNTNKVHPKILYPECLEDVFKNFIQKEQKYVLPPDFGNFLTHQKIEKPRAMLVNWLLRIQQYYRSDDGVFLVSVRLFDFLLSIADISRDQVQLVGIVTYWIAMKFYDIVSIPKGKDLVMLCQGEITQEQIFRTEQKILRFLDFDITVEEPMICVRYFIYVMELENCEVVSLCSNYILDCFVLDGSSGSHLLSKQAAAALHMSLQLLDMSTSHWERLKTLPIYYEPSEISQLKSRMFQMLQYAQDPTYQFREPFSKYMNKRYGGVSVLLLKKQIAT